MVEVFHRFLADEIQQNTTLAKFNQYYWFSGHRNMFYTTSHEKGINCDNDPIIIPVE